MGLIEKVKGLFRSKSLQPWVFDVGDRYSISPEGSLRLVSVFRCVELISTTCASLPIDVIERRGDSRVQLDHPVGRLLNESPNPDMTAFTFRAYLWASVLLWGNGYAYIARAGGRPDGELLGLYPLPPDRVRVERDQSGVVEYVYYGDTGVQRYKASEIFHLRIVTRDGVVGISPIEQCRAAVYLNRATEEYGANFYARGAGLRLAVEYPGRLSPEAIRNLRESFEQHYMSEGTSQRVVVLEQGAKVTSIGIPPRDAQYIEQQQWNDERIAMLFGVPPFLLGVQTKSTSWGTGIAEQKLGFATFTLLPKLAAFESECRRSLLTPKERGNIVVKHNMSAFLRASASERYKAYALAVDKGILSRDEVRALEDLDPIPGGYGRHYTVQAQYVPLSSLGKPEE